MILSNSKVINANFLKKFKLNNPFIKILYKIQPLYKQSSLEEIF
jgi:hypothetical protein